MKEYIEKDKVIETIRNQCVDGKMWGNEDTTLVDAYDTIDAVSDIPAAEAFNCPDNSCILLRAKYGDYTAKQIHDIMKIIKDRFPNTWIFYLPSDISIETCTAEQLQQIRNALDDYIERLSENEKPS